MLYTTINILNMPTSKGQQSYAQIWKNLTKYAIAPAVKNNAKQTNGSQKKRLGGIKQLHKDWLKPMYKLQKKSSRVKQRKTRTQKSRGGFIRGGSRMLPTQQEQCALLPQV